MLETIPFHVEINRIIDVLASQIYQSPLALLRENSQNAYDAILQRIYLGQDFEPQIEIAISEFEIRISDNGIGMTKEDLKSHYWQAGSSGKNSPEARAAGVVGTFGIGAMANFGVATRLTVITESALTGERTNTGVSRDELSASEDCITLEPADPLGQPGTMVIVEVSPDHPVPIEDAKGIVSEAVRFVSVPVTVNGELLSQHSFAEAVAKPRGGVEFPAEHVLLSKDMEAEVQLFLGSSAEPWVTLTNLRYRGNDIAGEVILAQEAHQIRTYRSSFALATAAVQSTYGLGGICNLLVLQPTAGREALTTESVQFLQTLVTEIERYISERIGNHPSSDSNTRFMEWVRQNGRYDLCSFLKIRREPNAESISLGEVRALTTTNPINIFSGSDQAVIDSFTDESPLLVLSARQPRSACENVYLSTYCKVNQVANKPTVLSLKPEAKWSLGESALAIRLFSILESDYYVQTIIRVGKISHDLPILINANAKPVEIVIDSESSTIAPMIQLYDTDYLALSSLAKDFIRTAIFPKITQLVPSSTRGGAQAFLKAIRRPRDIFEYEQADLGSLSEIWLKYLDGDISMRDAAHQSTAIVRTAVQVLEPSNTSTVANVISDVIDNERILDQFSQDDTEVDPFAALPAITRLDTQSSAMLLTIGKDEESLNGYRLFIALTSRTIREHGEFFLQPHRTEVVWGGQKALFIFQHHSGAFGLYYELQGTELLAERPGGQAFRTSTIVLKNQIYIPIPEQIQDRFIPLGNDRKRFEVRCDLLFPEPGLVETESENQPPEG